jgi:hypothetical protein
MVKLDGGQRPGFWFEISVGDRRRQFLVTFREKKGVNVAEGWGAFNLQIDWEWNS